MTKRYFYTDALAAAWMVIHHNMELARLMLPTAEYYEEFSENGGFLGCTDNPPPEDLHELLRQVGVGCGDPDYVKGKYYIHPDSLPLLKPQIDDIYTYRDAKGFLYLHQVHDVYDLNCEPGKVLTPHDKYSGIAPERIIQRQGTPFMWPESEEA